MSFISRIIFKDLSESNWTNPAYVGIPTFQSYQGRPVIVASSVLPAFRDFINSFNFPFAFDHAAAMFK